MADIDDLLMTDSEEEEDMKSKIAGDSYVCILEVLQSVVVPKTTDNVGPTTSIYKGGPLFQI